MVARMTPRAIAIALFAKAETATRVPGECQQKYVDACRYFQ
jgi:hypothetical protein